MSHKDINEFTDDSWRQNTEIVDFYYLSTNCNYNSLIVECNFIKIDRKISTPISHFFFLQISVSGLQRLKKNVFVINYYNSWAVSLESKPDIDTLIKI